MAAVEAPPSPASVVDYKECLRQKLPGLKASESMSAYCKRAGSVLDHKDCHVVQSMEQPGLYLFKRPFHTNCDGNVGGMSTQSLLKHAGSIMHHIVLYIKTEDELSALEMGPEGSADVHDNIFEAVESGPVHQASVAAPSDSGPFLHVDVPTHPLSHPAVQEAIKFAEGCKYHTLRGNCIQFADAMVRLLTGGAVFGAPLAYDAKAGDIPPVDSPLLGMLSITMQLSWLDVCDGAGFLADLLAAHEPPPQLAAALQLHTATALPDAEGNSNGDACSPADAFFAAQKGGGSKAPAVDIASLLKTLQPQVSSQSRGGTADAVKPNADGSLAPKSSGSSGAKTAGVPALPPQSKARGMKKGFLG